MSEAARPPEVDRAAASRKAVAARRARAGLKRDIATRVVDPQEVLRRATADASSPAGTLRVTEFLTALPAIGKGKRDRILEELQISPVKRLGGLGARQRAELTAWLDSSSPPPAAASAQRPRRARGPDGCGQGHGRDPYQDPPSRGDAVGLGDHACAAPRGGRTVATTASWTMRSSTA